MFVHVWHLLPLFSDEALCIRMVKIYMHTLGTCGLNRSTIENDDVMIAHDFDEDRHKKNPNIEKNAIEFDFY